MKKRKLWVSILAGVMAAIMVLSLLLSLIPTRVYALSSSEIKNQINELEDKKEELQAQMDELAAKQNTNLANIQDILDQKNLIDQQIGLLQAQIQNINDQIAAQNLLIADTQDELDDAEARLAELNEKNKERIRTMEEEGPLSYWSVLFKANSFADLLDRLNMVEELAQADQRRLREMREVAAEVEEVRDALTLEKKNLEDSKADLADSQQLLDGKREEADAHDQVHVVLDEHDSDVEPVPEHADVVHELVGLGGVHARRRLVEEQELGLRRQGPDDLQPPLVPVGQVPRQGVGLVGQVEQVQELQGPHVLPPLGAPPAGEPEHIGEHAVGVAVAHAHLHVVLHGHAGEEPDVLEGPGDAQPVQLVHGLAPGVLAVEQNAALGGLVHVGQQVEDRGLARAVGADEARDLRLADEEREVVHGP